MYKSLGFKLLGALGLCAALMLTACGGGGGDSGAPLLPPTSKLIMTPNISGVTLGLGQSAEPVKISGGQKPYYVGATGGVIPTLLDDGTVYLQAVAVTNSSSSSDTSSGSSSSSCSDYVWIQDSSYNQTQIQFNACVNPPPPLSGPLGSGSGTITMTPGQSQPLPVYGGNPPYTTFSDNTAVASVSGGTTGSLTITAGNTLGTANITVLDTYGSSYVITVQVVAATTALTVSPKTLSGAMGNVKSFSVVGGTSPYTQAISSDPNVATASVSGSLVSVSMVDAGSATITVYDSANATATVGVTVTNGFAIVPPLQLMPESSVVGTPVTRNFSVLNGPSMGPYYVSLPPTVDGLKTSSLITVSPMSFMGGTSVPLMTLVVTLEASCIKSDKTIPLTVTDSATGNTATATLQIQDSDPTNDGTPGCL
jgi:hypothetical protein